MPDSYDSVPYTSHAHYYTHPDMLCTIARLFGLSPAAPEACRVLALGCASAGNLIAMAELLPDSAFVGVDRSSVQIEEGRARVTELGLSNVDLRVADVLELDVETLGEFDYVIVHGVFAWVPRPVQDRLLELCAAVLGPQGVALVSYNVYPGWHMREMVRRMMLFHLRMFDEPTKQIEQARALVDFLAENVAASGLAGTPYAAQLEREATIVAEMTDWYLFHEHLERDNSPLYFHEFVERIAELPLRYLGDTDLNLMVARDLPKAVHEVLPKIAADQIAHEQYLDFLRNRQFRTTLLCREQIEPRWKINPKAAEMLRFGLKGQPRVDDELELGDPAALAPGVEWTFESASRAKIQTPSALTKAALVELCERWPATLPFDELLERALARLAEAEVEPEPEARVRLSSDLIECLLRKAVVARSWEPPLSTSVSPRPRVSALARILARREAWLPSLHHHRQDLNSATRKLVSLLDGTHDRAALAVLMSDAVRGGEVELPALDELEG